jgi:hypothetical protein
MNDTASSLPEIVAAVSDWPAWLQCVRQALDAPVDPMVVAAVTWAVVFLVLGVSKWRDRASWKAHERQMTAD